MNVVELKDAIRARDGFRCQDCGMTNVEHLEKHGDSLHVHRLIPGSAYTMADCVTLCVTCHGQKPKTLDQLIFRFPDERCGITTFWFNHYNITERAILDLLVREATRRGISEDDLLLEIFLTHYADELCDYQI